MKMRLEEIDLIWVSWLMFEENVQGTDDSAEYRCAEEKNEESAKQTLFHRSMNFNGNEDLSQIDLSQDHSFHSRSFIDELSIELEDKFYSGKCWNILSDRYCRR